MGLAPLSSPREAGSGLLLHEDGVRRNHGVDHLIPVSASTEILGFFLLFTSHLASVPVGGADEDKEWMWDNSQRSTSCAGLTASVSECRVGENIRLRCL